MWILPRVSLASLLAAMLVLSACAEQDKPVAKRSAPPEAPLVSGLPDFTALVEQEGPTVVNISSVSHQSSKSSESLEHIPEMFRRFFEQFADPDGRQPLPRRDARSLGSGFIISADGYILTNHHVVADADEIIVRLLDRREKVAELVGADPQSDLALLKIDGEDLPAVRIGSSDALKVGEWVLAIGAPFGFDSTVTAGIVSAKGRSLPGDNYVPFIQTDVAINPGNSGGPLFNLHGEVVGINSQIFSRSGGFMGLSFAIPMDMAMDVVNQLKDGGTVQRGWLGVLIQEVDRDLAESFGLQQPMGALVSQVVPDSPAEQAGLQPGDVIVAFEDSQIYRSSELPKLVGLVKPGSKGSMTVMRDGKEITLTVTVGQLPDDPAASLGGGSSAGQPADTLGLTVRAANPQELEKLQLSAAVVVTEVAAGPARQAGIRSGDVLVMLNNKPLPDPQRFTEVVASLPAGRTVSVLVNRDGSPRFLPLKLPEGDK